MPKAIPYEEAKEYIERFGHKLITTKEDYRNASQKLDILCPDGHVYKRTLCEFRALNQRCSERSCIEKRKKQTNMERYGCEHPAQSSIVKEKMVATNLAVRGVRNPSQDPLVKEKKEATNMERRGVKNPFQDPVVRERIEIVHLTTRGVTNVSQDSTVQEKRRQTMIDLHGVVGSLSHPDFLEKFKATSMEHWGVPHPAQSPIVQAHIMETNIERYGVPNVMQNAEILQRAVDNAHKLKSYTLPSGRVVPIQGYENWYLDHLFSVDKYPEDDVIFGSEIAKLPAIYYVFEGTRHRYYPDVDRSSSKLKAVGLTMVMENKRKNT